LGLDLCLVCHYDNQVVLQGGNLMLVQWLMVGLFAFNMFLCWLTVLTKKFRWFEFLAAVIFVVIPLLMVLFDQPRFELDYFWWRIAGLAAIIAGLGISIMARLVLIRAGIVLKVLPDKLVTTGPYRFVRHPQFLGLIFVWVGWWWVWSAVYAFYFGMFILILTWIEAYLEEKLIYEKQFGSEYKQYKKHTGMFWIK